MAIIGMQDLADKCVKRCELDYDVTIAVTGLEGVGKTQPKGSKVLMANGEWKTVENIKTGDVVLSPQKDGTYLFSRVKRTHTRFSDKNYDVIELNRQKKKLYSCSHNHIIPINYRYQPRDKKYKRKWKDNYWGIKNYPAEKYAKMSFLTKQNMSTNTAFYIPKYQGRKNCEIEPYTLGIWLGDGHFTKDLGITSNDFPIIEEISKYYPIMNILKKKGTTAKTYRFSLNGVFSKQLIRCGLRYKGSGTKFIPKKALLSNGEYRKRLLTGLIDSDGYKGKNENYSITTKSKKLSEDILHLVYSLGGRGRITKVKKGIKKLNFIGNYFCVSFYLGDMDLPLKCERKIRNKDFFYLSANRLSIDVIPSKSGQVYGFTLDSPSGWYITDNFMVTHNSTLAIAFARKIGKRKDGQFTFCLSRNVLFSPSFENVQDAIKNLPKYAPIVLDEAIKVLYKLRWHDKVQILLNQFFAICRQENKIAILCIPRFTDLNEYFRNHRVMIWLHVTERGRALVFVKDQNPFVKDVWHFKEMEKKMLKHNFNAMTYRGRMKLLKKNKSFVGVLKFKDLPLTMRERYKKLKALKKYTRNPEESMNKKEREALYRTRWITAMMYLHKWNQMTKTGLAKLFGITRPTIYKYFKDNKKEFDEIPTKVELKDFKDKAFNDALKKEETTQDIVDRD